MTLPRVVAEGNLVEAPHLRRTDSGKPWATFRIACHDRVRDGSGGWRNGPTTYVDAVCWGDTAENLVASTVAGDAVVVAGRLQQEEWTDRAGGRMSGYRVNADNVAVSVAFGSAPTAKVRAAAETAF